MGVVEQDRNDTGDKNTGAAFQGSSIAFLGEQCPRLVGMFAKTDTNGFSQTIADAVDENRYEHNVIVMFVQNKDHQKGYDHIRGDNLSGQPE